MSLRSVETTADPRLPRAAASWRGEAAVFLAGALAVAAFFHLRSPNVPDPDSFYHFRHAALYWTRGLFMTEFPWIEWSIIRLHAADIWYGFHLLLAPVSAILGPGAAIKTMGILLTALLLVSFRASLARLGIAGASFWPFLLLFAGPNVLLHFTMTRPHVLTAAISALLFSFCTSGRWLGPFLASLALSFFHMSLFWMAPVVVASVLIAAGFVERRLDWRMPAAAIAGLLCGCALRPNPLGAAKIAYAQIVEHTLVRRAGVPLLVGKELFPITWDVMALHFIPISILWIGAAALAAAGVVRARSSSPGEDAASTAAFRREADPSAAGEARLKTILVSSGLLSLLFFGMMLFLARRSFAPWALFSVIFIAAALTLHARTATESRRAAGIPSSTAQSLASRVKPRLVLVATTVLFAVMVVHATIRNRRNLDNAYPVDGSREAAEWIAARSAPGEIVFNVHWDAFPQLFLWNQKNRYVHGMDPIFLYDYDPSLYFKAFYVQIQKATAVTCGQAQCTAETLEDTYTVLERDFRARWLFVQKARTPGFYEWARSDPRFVPGYESATEAVFGLR